MESTEFQKIVLQGIPDELPELQPYDKNINHAEKTGTEKCPPLF
jgi:hypothetical protein